MRTSVDAGVDGPYTGGILSSGYWGGFIHWYAGFISPFVWGTGGSGYKVVDPGRALNDDVLHHLVMTVGTQWMSSYIDGEYVNRTDIATGFTPNPLGDHFRMGSGLGQGNGNPWSGSESVARIYPFALTPAQVSANYNAGSDW